MFFSKSLCALALLALGGLAASGSALAVPSVPSTCLAGCVHFAGSSGDLKAEVFFEQSGSDLLVTLVNAAEKAVSVPVDVLTGVYFTLMDGASLISLTPLTAYVADRLATEFTNPPDAQLAVAKSTDVNSSTPFDATAYTDANGINVGGEFGYAENINFQGAMAGISSTGLGLFGNGTFCQDGIGTNDGGNANCPEIAGPPKGGLNGVEMGIVPFVGFTSPNGGITTSNPYIQSAVQFKLSGLPTGFTLTSGALSNVGFQYGTSLTEPHFNAPTPATFALLGLGFVLLTGFTARRRPS